MAEEQQSPQIKKLESEIDEILTMYDFGEKLHSYEDVHGGRVLNENQRRMDMVAFNNSNGTSGAIMRGCSLWGLAALYMFSRRGAANPIDLSRLRQCGWTSASVFMVGTTFGCMFNLDKEKRRLNAA